jgi:hypothetical protein
VATRIPELAVIVSLTILGLRFPSYENHPLGYLLLGVAAVAGICWIYSVFGHRGKERGIRKRIGKRRLELTWATAAVLVVAVIYPWVDKAQAPKQQATERIAILAQKVEKSAPPRMANAPVQRQQEARGTSSTNEATGERAEPRSVAAPPRVPPAAPVVEQQRRGTAGQVNVLAPDQRPVTLTYSQIDNTVTVKPSASINSTSLTFFFDVEVFLSSHTLGMCLRCGSGRAKDSNGAPDNKTIWLWSSAPFTPDNPLSLSYSSPTPAKLLKVSWGPELPR